MIRFFKIRSRDIPVPSSRLPLLFTAWLSIIGNTPASAQTETTVAQDGSGNYTTLQSAIDALPANNDQPFVIHLKNGSYHEVVTLPKGKNQIHLIGESADQTIITYDNCANTLNAAGEKLGTMNSATVFVLADHFTAENLTFQNTAGLRAGQALAINIRGNFAAFRKCRFLGFQDTFYAAEQTVQSLKDCYLAGSVDFIFGGSTALFDRCTIHSLAPGYLTAASTPATTKYGYVFQNCRLTGDAAPGTVHLGRPWRPHASVVFLNCQMADHIKAEGWNNWGNPANEATARYAEFQSQGPGAHPGQRQPWSKQLTPEEAKAYTTDQILNRWQPF